MNKITLAEMNKIFKENKLKLGFPVDQKASHFMCVTDWNLWYHGVGYKDSDLKKFEDLIKDDPTYSTKYVLFNPAVGGTGGVKRIDN